MVSVIFWDLFFFLGMSAPDSISNEQTQNMGSIGNVLVGDFGAPCALRETGRLVGLDYGLKLRTCFGMLSVFSWKIYVRISRIGITRTFPKECKIFMSLLAGQERKKKSQYMYVLTFCCSSKALRFIFSILLFIR